MRPRGGICVLVCATACLVASQAPAQSPGSALARDVAPEPREEPQADTFKQQRLLLVPMQAQDGVSPVIPNKVYENMRTLLEIRGEFKLFEPRTLQEPPKEEVAVVEKSNRDLTKADEFLWRGKERASEEKFLAATNSFKQAVIHYQKGLNDLENFDKLVDARLGIALAYFFAGDTREGTKALKHVVETRPDVILDKRKVPKEALEALERLKRRIGESSAGPLKIVTSPPGAQVYVDGHLKGTSPAVIEGLTVGRHAVRVVYPDADAQARPFTTGPRKKTLKFRLKVRKKFEESAAIAALMTPEKIEELLANEVIEGEFGRRFRDVMKRVQKRFAIDGVIMTYVRARGDGYEMAAFYYEAAKGRVAELGRYVLDRELTNTQDQLQSMEEGVQGAIAAFPDRKTLQRRSEIYVNINAIMAQREAARKKKEAMRKKREEAKRKRAEAKRQARLAALEAREAAKRERAEAKAAAAAAVANERRERARQARLEKEAREEARRRARMEAKRAKANRAKTAREARKQKEAMKRAREAEKREAREEARRRARQEAEWRRQQEADKRSAREEARRRAREEAEWRRQQEADKRSAREEARRRSREEAEWRRQQDALEREREASRLKPRPAKKDQDLWRARDDDRYDDSDVYDRRDALEDEANEAWGVDDSDEYYDEEGESWVDSGAEPGLGDYSDDDYDEDSYQPARPDERLTQLTPSAPASSLDVTYTHDSSQVSRAWYKRWWVWTVAGVVVGGAVVGTVVALSQGGDEPSFQAQVTW